MLSLHAAFLLLAYNVIVETILFTLIMFIYFIES